ncbi:MAG: hypothetical protein AAGF12_14970 [Myxococcota bacterium]
MNRHVACMILWGVAACDCERSAGPEAGESATDPNDVAWGDIADHFGVAVPEPGSAPRFDPPAEQEVVDVEPSTSTLAEQPYDHILPGDPLLLVRTELLGAAQDYGARDTLVAFENGEERAVREWDTMFHCFERADPFVYAGGSESLVRVDLRDGSQRTLFEGRVLALALSDDHIFWATGGPARAGEGPGALHRMPRDGGRAELLYSGMPFVLELLVHRDRLYWIGKRRPRRVMDQPPGYLVSAPLSGGDPTTEVFASQRPTGLAIDNDAIYLLTEGTLGHSLNDSFNDGYVLRRAHGTNRWRALAHEQPMPSRLVVEESQLCWVASGNTRAHLRCVANTGGPVAELPQPSGIPVLAMDDGELYVSDRRGTSTLPLSDLP